MFINRLISICVLIPIIIFVLFSSSFMQFAIFIFIVCLASAWEWGKMISFSKNMCQVWMYVIFGLLCITMITVIFQNNLYFNFWYIFLAICMMITSWWILAFLLILSYPNSAIIWNKSDLLYFCFGILIILPFFWGILELRQFYYIKNHIIGTWWLLYIMTLIWINDSSAYVIGKILGRYKLLQNVSPQKTWEGCIGGILISIIFAWSCSKYISMDIIKPFIVFICSISAILVSIIGDLVISMFKRESGIKNTGNLIPGHGGILDRIDSLVAAVPVFTCLIFISIHWFNSS